MGVSVSGGIPKHLKMIIFSRKSYGFLGSTVLGNPQMDVFTSLTGIFLPHS